MLGIPSVGTPDYNSFVTSFWSALYSGFIYSIITGILVGLAIWKIQLSRDRRLKRNENEKELLLLKKNANYILNFSHDVLMIDDVTKCVPNAAIELTELAVKYPYELWPDDLSDDSKIFVKKLDDIKELTLTLKYRATQLHTNLKTSIRRHNALDGMIQPNDNFVYIFFVGKLAGKADEDIKAWMLPNPISLWVIEAYNRISNEESISVHTQNFSKSLDDLKSNLEDFKSLMTIKKE